MPVGVYGRAGVVVEKVALEPYVYSDIPPLVRLRELKPRRGDEVGGTNNDVDGIREGEFQRGESLTTHGSYTKGRVRILEVVETRDGVEVVG